MSFPPVPSTEITKDGKNLSPAWIAFFSQVFSNGGISASAVNSGTPTFSGNVTVANLTVTGTSSVAGNAGFASTVSFNGPITANSTATFNGPLTANSTASFAGPMTLGSTLSGVSASFTGPISGTTGTFTSGAVGNLKFSTTNIASSAAMTFQTTPSGGSATTALTIDQYRVVNFNSNNVTNGVSLTNVNAMVAVSPSFIYTDTQTAGGGSSQYATSYNYQPVLIDATNPCTYVNAMTFYVGGGPIPQSANVTITNSWSYWTETGSTSLAYSFYVGDGISDSKLFKGALVTQGALGYGTHPLGLPYSPGGAKTQLTTKSTAVTLNTACGTITMRNSALAAGASVEFVLNNTYIASTDVVICNMAPGGTASSYLVVCQAVAAGSCRFRVTNYSAGSLSEACVINFAIIKSVNV